MSKPNQQATDSTEYDPVDPPIGWDGQTLQEMLEASEERYESTGRYKGLETLEMKEETPFEYEKLYSRLRGALVSARETALNISASPIISELGELCFQVYTPEGDCVALSTGIIVHVHTGSLAIKWMIEKDYEYGRGINPGDVYCNNDAHLGNVHTTDVHTFVPIFDPEGGELIAWVDGVTHELDIGASSAGHVPMDSTSRYEDGFHVTCEKIGENDNLYQDWKYRGELATRTPMYWDLDEKCRLAGCHMVRDAVQDIVADVGTDDFKQFMNEAVEEGRQIMLDRVQERLFPGTYRTTAFYDRAHKDSAHKPEQQQNELIHLPVEIHVDDDGGFAFDMEGTTSPGPHPNNAASGCR